MVKPWNWKGQQCWLADIHWLSGIATRRRNIVMWERQVSTKPIRAAGKRGRNASSYNKAPDKICLQTHVGYPLEKHGNTWIKEIFRQWAALMAVGEIAYHRRQNPDDVYPTDEKTWSRRRMALGEMSKTRSLIEAKWRYIPRFTEILFKPEISELLRHWAQYLKKRLLKVWSKPLKIISYFLGDLKSLHKPLFLLTPTILVFEGKTELK